MPIINKYKERIWPLLNAVLVVAVLVGLSAAYYFYKSSKSLAPARTFAVTAEGKTVVAPDVASFTFTVVSEGSDPEKIASDNDKKINAALDFIKTQGIESKDIKTANYNLSPRYEYDQNQKKTFISGYTLTQTVFVKIRDFAKIGKILGKLPDLGINQIGSLTFDIENPDKYLNEARQQAFEKAYAKAKSMADQNHVWIGGVVTFSEFSGFRPPMPVYETFGKIGGLGAPAAPSIEPGSQEVTVNVSVTYEIW